MTVAQAPPNDAGTAEAAFAAVKAVKAGKSKDVDIAAQILAQYDNEEDCSWTIEEEKKLIRKVDWMIVPIVSVAWNDLVSIYPTDSDNNSFLFVLHFQGLTRRQYQLLPYTDSRKI